MEITMNETRFTRKEAQVLDLLERNPGRVVTRKFLLENVGIPAFEWMQGVTGGYRRMFPDLNSWCDT